MNRPANNCPPARALAWSDCALDHHTGTTPRLAVWKPAGTTVAIGLSQKPAVEIVPERMAEDAVDLVRRQSGGGAVLLYDGVLCWEAWTCIDQVAAAEGDDGIRATYRFLCRPVREALGEFGLEAVHAGVCDISIAGPDGTLRKIAGTAQLRRKRLALVHGSLLVCPDMDRLSRYLQFPSSQPDYRAGRSHRDFCRSLAEWLEASMPDPDSLLVETAAAIERAADRAGWNVGEIPAVPTPEEVALEQAKYRNPEWNWQKIRPSR